MPSSARRRAASRANGRKSHGPVTPEGKARSAANAPARHGLASPDRAAHSICLNNENPAEFMLLYEALVTEFAPVTTAEHLTVHEMAVSRWRLNRALAMESALMDNEMDHMAEELKQTYQSTDEATRGSLAFRRLTEDSPSLAALHRYETRLTRQFDRCLARLANLAVLREKRQLPTEPSPIIEHPATPRDNQLPTPSIAPIAQPTMPAAAATGIETGNPTPQPPSAMASICPPVRPETFGPAPGGKAPLPRTA